MLVFVIALGVLWVFSLFCGYLYYGFRFRDVLVWCYVLLYVWIVSDFTV